MLEVRVASLLPSATEIVCALGFRRSLVGVSHECDWPPDVVGLPVLTSTRLDIRGASARIDRNLRQLLQDSLAVYDVDIAALKRASPDVIVTQDLCDVCAVSLDDVRRAAAELTQRPVDIVNLHPAHLGDIWEDIGRVGSALQAIDRTESLLERLRTRITEVQRRAQGTPNKPHVLTVEWIDPLMVGGTWMPELVELAGGVPLVTHPGQHAPTLGLDELKALDPQPEVVIVKPCGFKLERTLSEIEELHHLFRELDWPAIRENRIFLADGNAYFNRPGPRIVASLEILAHCLHPECFDLAEEYRTSVIRLPVSV